MIDIDNLTDVHGNKEECDHDWEAVGDSFDPESGTENILYQRCTICGEETDLEIEWEIE